MEFIAEIYSIQLCIINNVQHKLNTQKRVSCKYLDEPKNNICAKKYHHLQKTSLTTLFTSAKLDFCCKDNL